MITKTACNKNNYSRRFIATKNARNAWFSIIEHYKQKHPKGKVLLPAYIGWSPKEGSGIFDSVVNANMNFGFYSLDRFLQIDIADFKSKVETEVEPLILLVHYFGFIDNKYEEIIDWLKAGNQYFVEDCAHAMLTDLVGGKCGREGIFSIYSLHKLLPVTVGGILVNNKNENIVMRRGNTIKITDFNLGFDLINIAHQRRKNYFFLAELLANSSGVTILQPELKEGVIPQTLPVLIHSYNRDNLYFLLNEKGFGVVSLYHTMINQLNEYTNDAVTFTSKHILNLPIHQDACKSELRELGLILKSIL